MIKESIRKIFLMILLGSIFCGLPFSSVVYAQYWTPLPPYNTLWPLWSPALSPVDPVTGFPVPIVSALYPSTILPVQPGLTWDPALSYPWLLYNTPVGMAYYDPIAGINPWPPSYLVGSSGPLPLTLPLDYSSLAPTDSIWLTTNVPLANTAFIAYTGIVAPPLLPVTSLIAAPVLPLLTVVAAPVLPVPPVVATPLLPVPTVIAAPVLPIPTVVAPASTNTALSVLIASLLINTGNPQVRAVLLLIASDPTLLNDPLLLNSLINTGNPEVALVLALLVNGLI